MEEGHEFSLQSTLLSAVFWWGQIGLKFLANETPRGWCRWPVCYHYYGVHFSLGSHTSDKNGIEGHLGQDICAIPLEGQVSKLCNAAGAAESKCKTRQDSIGICSSDSEDPQVPRKWHCAWAIRHETLIEFITIIIKFNRTQSNTNRSIGVGNRT